MDTYVQIARIDKDHNFAYDVKRVVRGKLERHIVDGADAVEPFKCRQDARTRLDTVPVSKTPTVFLDIFDVITTDMWSL